MPTSSPSSASTVTPEVSALIRARLEAFVQGELDRDGMSAELTAICGKYPEASWEVLALLDQFHRQGHLSSEIFQAVKAETQQLIFGPPHADETGELRIRADTVALEPGPQTPVEWDRIKPARADSVSPFSPRANGGTPQPPLQVQQQLPQKEMSPAALAPGAVLRDRYVIEAPLGRGGMCTIFKALDRHRLNLPPADRHVAIKVLRDEASANPEAVLALQDEFCIAQSLSHPNIVNVFDLDRDGDRHFITMELIDGESLSRMIGRLHPDLLPLAQAFEYIREIGIALQYAHERGVVHADLKPGNIMITEGGRVRLLDFGVASRTSRDPLAADTARRPPIQAATPAYASRERNMRWAPDPRDDIYSLACITYELLTGLRPFASRPTGSTHPDRIRLRRVRGLTRGQWRTLRQGLAADRERRPKTVREWLDGLELHQAAVDERPRHAMPAGARRPALPRVGFGIAVIVAAVAFFVMSGTGPLRDLPLAVATRNLVSDVLAPANDPAPAAGRGDAKSGTARSGEIDWVEQPARSEPPVVPVADPNSAAGEPTVSHGEGAQAEVPADGSEIATPARKARSPVVRGPGVLYFTRDHYSVREGDTVARLTVLREAGSDGEVGFRWRAIGSSAKPGEDYAEFDAASEHLSHGQETAVLYIPIMDDAHAEDTESFYVEIESARGGASLGPITRATVIITDDD